MMESYKDIQFGISLQLAVSHKLEFLQLVNDHPLLYEGPVLRSAVRRYEKFWLPLAAKYSSATLDAPLDIAWVWHCHMLAPQAYDADCRKLFGLVIDHRLSSEHDRNLSLSNDLWVAEYPGEAFQVPLDVEPKEIIEHTTQLSYDLEAAVARQKLFFYQVSLPHYQYFSFVYECEQRYKQFLLLKKQHPNQFIVPCYDIDIAWHAHQLHPVIYRQDTEKYCGEFFNHDDSVNDRSPKSKLEVSYTATKNLWKEMFHQSYQRFGCMFRGEPPNGLLNDVIESFFIPMSSKVVSVKIMSANVNYSGLKSKKIKKIKIKALLLGGDNISLLTLKKPSDSNSWEFNNGMSYDIDTKYTQTLLFEVYQKTSLVTSLTKGRQIAYAECQLDKFLEDCQNVGVRERKNLTLNLCDGASLNLVQDVVLKETGKVVMTLAPGEFIDYVVGEKEMDTFWGPVAVAKEKQAIDSTVTFAEHQILQDGSPLFSCKVIHSLKLMTSVLQVFSASDAVGVPSNSLLVVAQMAGLEQLPSVKQVPKDSKKPTLDPRKGERSFIVKNNSGDYAVIVGCWMGVRKGQRNRPGSLGHLEVRIYYLQGNKSMHTHSVKRLDDFIFSHEDLMVDLISGRIDCGVSHMPEKIAIGCCVSLLHVLCQPRPRDWEPGKPLAPPEVGRRIVLKTSDAKMLVCMGLFLLTPSNHYIQHSMPIPEYSSVSTGSSNLYKYAAMYGLYLMHVRHTRHRLFRSGSDGDDHDDNQTCDDQDDHSHRPFGCGYSENENENPFAADDDNNDFFGGNQNSETHADVREEDFQAEFGTHDTDGINEDATDQFMGDFNDIHGNEFDFMGETMVDDFAGNEIDSPFTDFFSSEDGTACTSTDDVTFNDDWGCDFGDITSAGVEGETGYSACAGCGGGGNDGADFSGGWGGESGGASGGWDSGGGGGYADLGGGNWDSGGGGFDSGGGGFDSGGGGFDSGGGGFDSGGGGCGGGGCGGGGCGGCGG